MAQHDMVLDDAAGIAFRADINNALAAIVSNNSGATEPATTYAYMWWADTTSGWLKQRNAANNAWLNKITLSAAMTTVGAALYSAANAAAARTAIGAAASGANADITGLSAIAAGTALLPSITPTGDTNTGVWFPAADTVAVSTNGSERMLIDSSGNVQFQATGAAITNVASINGGQIAGFRNKIINGGMQVAQRGTVAVTAGPTNYTLDHWQVVNSGTGLSATVASGVQAASPSGYAMTIAGSWTSGITYAIQRIESRNANGLYNKAFVVSVYMYHDFGSATNFTVQALSANSNDNFAALTSITATSGETTSVNTETVTRLIAYFPANTALENGLQIQIAHASTTVSAKTLRIWGAQVEVGSVATPFESRPIGTELALCQRYYYRTTPVANGVIGIGSNDQTTTAAPVVNFPETMRIAPTAIEQSGTAGNYSVKHGVTTTACSSVPTILISTKNTCSVRFTVASGLTVGQCGHGISTAAAGYLGFTAEL